MAQPVQTISFVEALRINRVGALLSGLVVMLFVALLLSSAVPQDINVVIELLLILLLSAAIGFAVRYTSPNQGAATLGTAAFLAAIGTPIMLVTGSAKGSFGEALLQSFATDYLAVASAFAAVIAVICAGWGRR